ncbi:hypothetical protein GcC1_034030 [Golovinomyces cichoracearum]|uniref:Uncharacterized protein n=1 Tax=Golovinomyces cichoracearum TaxID=62708 RepID=A0A420J1J8_9PEZI|nr:hypothetical protein GcC1_034030 [Golovinomyces cichoracearum]
MMYLEGKRVRRADLNTTPPSSQSYSESERNKLIEILASRYDTTTNDSKKPPLTAVTKPDHHLQVKQCNKLRPSKNNNSDEYENSEIQEEDSEREYEFFLFSKGHSTFPPKIILRREHQQCQANLEKRKSGFMVPHRPMSYYFAPKAKDKIKVQYFSSAVEGETIRQWSRQRAWGLEMPWRVRVLKTHDCSKNSWNPNKESKIVQGSNNDDCEPGINYLINSVQKRIKLEAQENSTIIKKKRPGKKSRISVRKKKRALVVLEEQQTREKEFKIQAERLKRIRRNREKKIKRKLKKKVVHIENKNI